MQEQVPSNITPEQGWSQMKVILDREMPVSRRSRRIVFLWRSLMAVGILTAFSFILWDNANTMQPTETPEAPQQEQPVPPIDEKKVTKEEVNFADATPASESSLAIKQELTGKHNATGNRNTGNAADKAAYRTLNKAAIAHSESGQGTSASNKMITAISPASESLLTDNTTALQSASEHTASALTAQQAVENSAQSFEQDVIPTADPSAMTMATSVAPTLAVRNGQVTPCIPGLDVDVLAIEDRMVDMASIESSPLMIKPARKNKQWLGAYVSTGAMAAQHNGAAWQGGAGLSIKVLPKLRLSAGGSYRTFSPDFRAGSKDAAESLDGYGSIVVQDEVYDGVPNYVNDFSLNASTDYQAVEPLVKTIRQWQVDAGLSYDISKRWFIQAGASYALQTTGISTVPILADAINFDPVKARFDRSLENYNIIREHMISLNGGIGYHVGSHWDIYAQVDHSINPYLESEPVTFGAGTGTAVDRTDYIRGVTLGIKYRWL